LALIIPALCQFWPRAGFFILEYGLYKKEPGFLRRAGVRRIVMKKHCCRLDDDHSSLTAFRV
jgi:hypothetical protein